VRNGLGIMLPTSQLRHVIARTSTHIRTHTHACTLAYTHARTHIHMHAHKSTRLSPCKVRRWLKTLRPSVLGAHTHTHTYTHTYIHKHTYIPLHSAEMAKDIEAQRAWRRSTMAPQSTRAGLLMPYTRQVR
jgi:hypothetical protein